MDSKIAFILDSNPLIRRYLREHSYYYKNLIRNPNFINNITDLMKKEYHLTLSDKLNKIKDDINLVNSFMDIIK